MTGNIKVIQKNAIGSWISLRPECEILLFSNAEGMSEFDFDSRIRFISDVACNEYGTPLVNSMFQTAQKIAAHDLLCYINADIILLNDFLKAISMINIRPFLTLGRRWDIDIKEPLKFQDPNWESELKVNTLKKGKLHGIAGIDYFVFPCGLYQDIPPLAIGRPWWDNWLIYNTRLRKIPVIHATSMITAVHQNHGHSDYPGGEDEFWKGPEAKRNVQLAGGPDNAFTMDYITVLLTPSGLKPAIAPKNIYFRLRAIAVLYPRLRFLLPLFKTLEKILKRTAIGYT